MQISGSSTVVTHNSDGFGGAVVDRWPPRVRRPLPRDLPRRGHAAARARSTGAEQYVQRDHCPSVQLGKFSAATTFAPMIRWSGPELRLVR